MEQIVKFLIILIMIKIIKNKIKIVTHHWSTHKNKGFEVYSYLDELLNDVECSNKIDFTFIGNLPKIFNLKIQDILSQKMDQN